MPTKRTLTRQLADARRQRDAAYEARDVALKDADGERFNTRRLSRQISDARDEIDALRKEATEPAPAPAGPAVEPQTTRRELLLVNRARRALVDQIEELRRCNDDLSREAVDRAGNLAPRGVAR
ncbi:hypothetical protein [Streptomyces sp. CA-111067]|uniref:hypothetical protein n=1 Tax=Streptomyces sp. CA-111067 TaxID=3240046 RepID=UPI003D9724DC